MAKYRSTAHSFSDYTCRKCEKNLIDEVQNVSSRGSDQCHGAALERLFIVVATNDNVATFVGRAITADGLPKTRFAAVISRPASITTASS